MDKDLQKFLNARNNALGHDLEDGIRRGCQYYESIGFARIVKMPEPFRVVGKEPGGRATVRFVGAAEPDFIGCLHNGRMIAFEAKHTMHNTIKQDAVTEQQARALQKYTDMGAVTGVVVGIGTGCNAYFVPWLVFGFMQKIYGRKYMTEEELKPYRVRSDLKIYFCDKMALLQSFLVK